MRKPCIAGLAPAAVLEAGATAPAQHAAPAGSAERQTMATQRNFYCDSKALKPAERAHHKQLSEKLVALRTQTVETAKGYEFQYRPADVSLAELADWVAAESKCCSFFDFHIDLEDAGKLLCLRLTGEEGIKTFIRTGFQIAPK